MTRPLPLLGVFVLALGPSCAADRTGLAGRDAAPLPDAGERDGGSRDAGGIDDASSADAAADEDGGVERDAGRDVDGGDGGDGGVDGGVDADAGGGVDGGRSCDSFVPTRTGLVLHYDARFGITTEEAEDGRPRVTTWLDQSGQLNHGAGRDVVFEPEGLGVGRPTVRTQGLDESHVELRNPSLDDFTIFVVMRTSYRRNAGNWYDAPCILGGDASGDQPDAALVLPDGKLGFTRQEAGHALRSGGRIDDGRTRVIAARRDGASGDVVIRVDGADFESGTSTTGRIEQPSNWWIAAHGDHARGRLDASFAEGRVYDRQLSDEELGVVEARLRCVWIE